jgi:hypothetical protein
MLWDWDWRRSWHGWTSPASSFWAQNGTRTLGAISDMEGGGEKHSKHMDLTLLIHIYIGLQPGRKDIRKITKLAKDFETGKCKIVSTELIVDLVRPLVAVSFSRILSINVFYRT